MSLGRTPDTKHLFHSSEELCALVPHGSLYAVLFRESRRLFPDDTFADLYGVRGRPSVPPRILAVVMVLQRFEGLSDREAVERFAYDVRWKYACGGLDLDDSSFSHSVLVETRARLRSSKAPTGSSTPSSRSRSATRPKVERKLAHLVRRRHGGRRARVRGTERIARDFAMLAAAVNLARLAALGLRKSGSGWAV